VARNSTNLEIWYSIEQIVSTQSLSFSYQHMNNVGGYHLIGPNPRRDAESEPGLFRRLFHQNYLVVPSAKAELLGKIQLMRPVYIRVQAAELILTGFKGSR
jgi:hypothetical protein